MTVVPAAMSTPIIRDCRGKVARRQPQAVEEAGRAPLAATAVTALAQEAREQAEPAEARRVPMAQPGVM
ncbi:hypothetical protein ACFOLL_16930 [Falsochrobactrum ovis]|uniref:hypothetical protein n=1 Tax=Falsochrobactrum ovis TaxID=1293442 RepID=UPI0011B94603|nr:hypothetical protein [Falsochrobactrum ovis]